MFLLTVAWSFLLLELIVRLYFSFHVGSHVLLWGTQWHRQVVRQRYMRGGNVFEHENHQAGYSKYFPNQKRTDVDTNGVPFDVTINGKGFRGADYEIEKQPDTLRILTLGASSTFGFGNRDEETYPFILQEFLTERLNRAPCGGKTHAEVINLGIPHLNSIQIAELFAAEGLAYQPDAVTVYTGYNNTLGLGQGETLKAWSRTWLVINFIRVARQQSSQISGSQIHGEIETRTRSFVAGLENILTVARKQDVAVLPITQQVRALPTETILQQHLTYDDEMDVLEKKLISDGNLSPIEGKVLIHQSLTRALRHWAQENNLELIDGIDLLNQHRYLLTSYVHLAPLANELIALAIADGLATRLGCPQLEP